MRLAFVFILLTFFANIESQDYNHNPDVTFPPIPYHSSPPIEEEFPPQKVEHHSLSKEAETTPQLPNNNKQFSRELEDRTEDLSVTYALGQDKHQEEIDPPPPQQRSGYHLEDIWTGGVRSGAGFRWLNGEPFSVDDLKWLMKTK